MKYIDIIIPAYNAKKQIDKLFQSFERQNNNQFRAIVVDDGSSDGTYDYCLALSKKYSFDMLVTTQQNQGPGIARRTGLELSDSEYVMFCDADDYLDDEALNTIVKILSHEALDVLEFGYQKVNEQGEKMASLNLTDEYIVTGCLAHYIKHANTTDYLWNKVFRRSIMSASDFKPLFYCEDVRALAFIFPRCSKVRVINNKLYYYVISDNSACGQRFSSKRLDMLKADEDIINLIHKYDLSLLPFAVCNACDHITKLYRGFYRSSALDNELSEFLRNTFMNYYRILKSDRKRVYKTKSKRQIFAIELYKVSPFLFRGVAKIYKSPVSK